MAKTQNPHIVLLPTPGMGHLIPLVEFAKRLIQQHPDFSISFVIMTNGSPSKTQKSVLDSLPASIDYVFLPPVNPSDLPQDSRIETIISLTVVLSLPALRDFFKLLVAKKSPPVALVVDLFGTDAFDVSKEFNVSPYIFFPSTAMTLSLFFHLPKLDETVSCEYRDMTELKLPGCIPIHGKDLLDPVQDRKDDAYKWVLHHAKRYATAEGIIVNSFMDMEEGALKALQEEEPRKPPIYPVGPLVNTGSSSGDGTDGSECLKWLDDQPHGSVLYVSFGSGGTLCSDQINELALGLEMSEQRFLWVARSPNDITNSTYFTVNSQNDPLGFLPKGFLDRTRGQGLVVPSWAPQAQVLRHGSTGGFLTHCGWNSTLESVVNGVPLIAWPLYAEQQMNSVMLTEDLKVALRPKASENGLIKREEIAKVVKDLMEGEEGKGIRYRMKELKDAASKVLSEDGTSRKALSELAVKWKNQKSS